MNPFKSSLKTLVLIDGVHLAHLGKRHNMHIEFKEFRNLLSGAPLLGSPRYYTTVQVSDGEPRSGVQTLIEWLSFHGYNVTSEEVYQFPKKFEDTTSMRWSQNNIAAEMMLDALQASMEPGFDRLLLISGNKELVPVIKRLRRANIQVEVFSSLELNSVAEDLRRNCDYFHEFVDYAPLFWKERIVGTTNSP